MQLPKRDVSDNMGAVFTGFGQTSSRARVSSVLLKMETIVSTAKKCQKDYARMLGIQLLSNHVCFTAHVRDARTGRYGVGGLCLVSPLPFF